MTGTSVKDVGLMLGSTAASKNVNAKNLSQNGFQKVWDSQPGRETSRDTEGGTQNVVKKTPGESLKAREAHRVRTSGMKPVEEAGEMPGELTGKQLEDAIAMLETAALELTEQIANTFGVSTEEVQTTMEELGMDSLDVLNPGKLGQLLLEVSGAEDSYALITSETLYGSYQELMGQLESVMQEAGDNLNLETEQLKDLLEKMQEQPGNFPTEEKLPEISVESVGNSVEGAVEETAERPTEKTAETTVDVQTAVPEEATGKKESSGLGGDSGAENENSAEEWQRPESGKGEINNLMLQNLKAEQFQPESGQTISQSTMPWNADTQNIMKQIMDYMKIQVKPEMSDMEMQLHPQSLGTLQIHVASRGGIVTANFITQNEAVKSALESQMIQLQQNFEEQGIKVNAIEVTVQTHEFERNLDQGRGNNQNQEPAKRNRIRRIHVNDLSVAEEMEQEDILAADMMAADGNTVDYTA